jgi:hypothetical protein
VELSAVEKDRFLDLRESLTKEKMREKMERETSRLILSKE